MSVHEQLPEVFLKNGVLRSFAKFMEKYLCQSLFFKKVAGLFIKKEALTQVFFCEFCGISKNTFFTEHLLRLLLSVSNLKTLIKQNTCFKNPENPIYNDLIPTNSPRSFQSSSVFETGLPDFHKLTITVLKQ